MSGLRLARFRNVCIAGYRLTQCTSARCDSLETRRTKTSESEKENRSGVATIGNTRSACSRDNCAQWAALQPQISRITDIFTIRRHKNPESNNVIAKRSSRLVRIPQRKRGFRPGTNYNYSEATGLRAEFAPGTL